MKKKTFALWAMFLLTLCALATTALAQDETYDEGYGPIAVENHNCPTYPGNPDCVDVNVSNVLEALRMAVGLDDYYYGNRDKRLAYDIAPMYSYNGVSYAVGDGVLNVGDVLVVLRTAVGLESPIWPERQMDYSYWDSPETRPIEGFEMTWDLARRHLQGFNENYEENQPEENQPIALNQWLEDDSYEKKLHQTVLYEAEVEPVYDEEGWFPNGTIPLGTMNYTGPHPQYRSHLLELAGQADDFDGIESWYGRVYVNLVSRALDGTILRSQTMLFQTGKG